MARGVNEGVERKAIQYALQNIRTIGSGELQANVSKGEPRIRTSDDYARRDLYHASKGELARREQEKLRNIAREERVKQQELFIKQQEELRKALQREFEIEREKMLSVSKEKKKILSKSNEKIISNNLESISKFGSIGILLLGGLGYMLYSSRNKD